LVSRSGRTCAQHRAVFSALDGTAGTPGGERPVRAHIRYPAASTPTASSWPRRVRGPAGSLPCPRVRRAPQLLVKAVDNAGCDCPSRAGPALPQNSPIGFCLIRAVSARSGLSVFGPRRLPLAARGGVQRTPVDSAVDATAVIDLRRARRRAGCRRSTSPSCSTGLPDGPSESGSRSTSSPIFRQDHGDGRPDLIRCPPRACDDRRGLAWWWPWRSVRVARVGPLVLGGARLPARPLSPVSRGRTLRQPACKRWAVDDLAWAGVGAVAVSGWPRSGSPVRCVVVGELRCGGGADRRLQRGGRLVRLAVASGSAGLPPSASC